MQKGSLVLATVGLALTIVGTVINEWLVYNPEEWEVPNGQIWGAPATIGLWAYFDRCQGYSTTVSLSVVSRMFSGA